MSAESERAAARAVLGSFMAELLAEPDDDGLTRLREPAARRRLECAARVLGIPDERVAQVPGEAALHEVRAARMRLWGHATRGACPANELEYGRRDVFQQAHTLADVAAFYRAFGLEVRERTERADHATAEWEFLAIVAWKEAHAPELLGRDADSPEVRSAIEACRSAQQAFLSEHAGRWMPAMFAGMRRMDASGFFARVADLGEAVLGAWCADFGVAPGPQWLELRPPDEEDAHIECGPGPEPGKVEIGAGLAAALAEQGRA